MPTPFANGRIRVKLLKYTYAPAEKQVSLSLVSLSLLFSLIDHCLSLVLLASLSLLSTIIALTHLACLALLLSVSRYHSCPSLISHSSLLGAAHLCPSLTPLAWTPCGRRRALSEGETTLEKKRKKKKS